MLVDTDVFIWFMQGRKEALEAVQSLEKVTISAITYMELVQGLRSKKELAEMEKLLEALKAEILPVDTVISNKSMELVKTLFHSHSVEFGDALIGATAMAYQMPVLTANKKHFQPMEGLEVNALVLSS